GESGKSDNSYRESGIQKNAHVFLLGTDDRVSFFREHQQVADTDFYFDCIRIDLRPFAGLPLNSIQCVAADVEANPLRNKTVNTHAIGILHAQQIDTGT